jgi:hypothetical protein
MLMQGFPNDLITLFKSRYSPVFGQILVISVFYPNNAQKRSLEIFGAIADDAQRRRIFARRLTFTNQEAPFLSNDDILAQQCAIAQEQVDIWWESLPDEEHKRLPSQSPLPSLTEVEFKEFFFDCLRNELVGVVDRIRRVTGSSGLEAMLNELRAQSELNRVTEVSLTDDL